MLLTPAGVAELGHSPIQASQFQQALRMSSAHSSAKLRNSFMVRHSKCGFAALRTAGLLATSTAMPIYDLIQPDGSELRAD